MIKNIQNTDINTDPTVHFSVSDNSFSDADALGACIKQALLAYGFSNFKISTQNGHEDWDASDPDPCPECDSDSFIVISPASDSSHLEPASDANPSTSRIALKGSPHIHGKALQIQCRKCLTILSEEPYTEFIPLD